MLFYRQLVFKMQVKSTIGNNFSRSELKTRKATRKTVLTKGARRCTCVKRISQTNPKKEATHFSSFLSFFGGVLMQ